MSIRKLRSAEIPRRPPEEVLAEQRHPIVAVLADIRSAYNVGAIFRTADALLVERIVCCGYTPTPEHHSVAKTALGAEAAVPWQGREDAVQVLEELRTAGYHIAALEQTDRPTPLSRIQAGHFPLALVVGNEVEGVDQRVLDACDLAIELPQYGSKTSLNVAVAFGVAGYGLIGRMKDIERHWTA